MEYLTDYRLSNDQFGYLLTQNEQYLILFSDEIWIIDLFESTIRKSKVAPPLVSGRFHASHGYGYIDNEILSNGYIRDCWNKNKDKLQNVRYPPIYLIKIIEKYGCNK